MLSRDLKILRKKKLLENKNTDKMRTAFDWLTRRLDIPEERISEFTDSFFFYCYVQTEKQRE